MNWLSRFSQHAGNRETLAAIEKLKGYYDLAKEALERAYAADTEGDADRALRLYRKGLEVVYEGLALPVQSPGLGATADSVTFWRSELNTWQANVQDRVRALESGTASNSRACSGTGLQRSRSLGPAAPQRTSGPGAALAPAQRAAKSGPIARSAAGAATPCRTSSSGASTAGEAGGSSVTKEEARYRQAILAEVLDQSPAVKWEDVAGLLVAKRALQEAVILPALRADIFQGLRAPVRGILLYGPPGNGKTMLGKALARESRATFFNISAASLTSKWVGEGEKLVRTLFQLASERQPSIIFIDEIDSILSARSSNEHDAMRRLKTEFLVQFDGVASGDARVVVIGATNRPQELDDAVRRRLVKRIYIPLPDEDARRAVLQHLLRGQKARLAATELERVVRATQLYSASDLAALCREAAMEPVRELGLAIADVSADSLRPITLADFSSAIKVIKPSVNAASLKAYEEFTQQFGTM